MIASQGHPAAVGPLNVCKRINSVRFCVWAERRTRATAPQCKGLLGIRGSASGVRGSSVIRGRMRGASPVACASVTKESRDMQSASQRDSIALPRASASAASPTFGVALRTRPVRPPCTTTPCGCRLAGATRAKHQIEQLQAFVETEGRLFPLGLEPFASYFSDCQLAIEKLARSPRTQAGHMLRTRHGRGGHPTCVRTRDPRATGAFGACDARQRKRPGVVEKPLASNTLRARFRPKRAAIR